MAEVHKSMAAVGPSSLLSAGLSIILASTVCGGGSAYAKGGNRPAAEQPLQPRRAVRLERIPNRSIEMPAADIGGGAGTLVFPFGNNVSDRLVSKLVTDGRFRVLVNPGEGSGVAELASSAAANPDPVLIDDPVMPSFEVTAQIKELFYTTGEKAERVFYGFSPGFENPYNAGHENRSLNEFGSRPQSPAFGDTGDLHFGKDLGSELNLNLFWLGASLHYAKYTARMGVEITYYDVLARKHETRRVTTTGEGVYFEVGAHYLGYMGAIHVARRASMVQAFDGVVDTLAAEVARRLSAARILAEVHRIGGRWYIGAGRLSHGLSAGQRFYSHSALERGGRPHVIVVEEAFDLVSRVRPEVGTPVDGDIFASLNGAEAPPRASLNGAASRATGVASASSSSASGASGLSVVEQNLTAPRQEIDVARELARFIEDAVHRFFKGLAAIVTLPWRLARFGQYDQAFQAGEPWSPSLRRAIEVAGGNPMLQALGAPQAWQGSMGTNRTIIAVLDTGVDYNHQELRRNNFFDAVYNRPGFDFYSFDLRPFDDHAHGTAVAGAAAGGGFRTMGVAPYATIMPVKVFSSYGETTSAAVYGGIRYAIGKGAHIIVLGWTSPVRSQALLEGIRLAKANGVLVVAAAGDEGVDLSRAPRYPASFADEDPTLDNLLVVAGLDGQGRYFRGAGGSLNLASNYGGPTHLAVPAVTEALVPTPRGGYGAGYHTGVAAGAAAGAAALVHSYCPSTATYQGVTAALMESAKSAQGLGIKQLSLNSVISIARRHCNGAP